MGQILSEPVTSKESHSLRSDRMHVGSSCMQGWRVSMEDAHTHILQLPNDPDAAFFAVFDGHGGGKVAEFASKNLHKVLVQRPEYAEGHPAEALRQTCLQMDQLMLSDEVLKDNQAGSTVISVLIKNDTLYCANLGDSRAIACVDGRVEVLSHDHKPNNKCEVERITAAGGWVEANRVNGNLALSRALGDFVFKRNPDRDAQQQIVTAYPEVEIRQISDSWEFIVLACDGIWDVLSNEEVVEFVQSRLAGGMEPEEICEDLMTRCLAPDCFMAGLGCDNMSVIIVCLLPDGSLPTLRARCQTAVVARATATISDSDDVDTDDNEPAASAS